MSRRPTRRRPPPIIDRCQLAETQSPNYKWIKPDIGGDASTWGNVLNQTIDAVDSVVYANQQAGVPIGSVTMFAGSTPPANWLLCQGQNLSTTTYAALFAVIGYTYGGGGGGFDLPNLSGQFPLGSGATNPLGQNGGSYSYTLDVAHMPSHAHPITDVGHNHSVNQWSHSHGIATGGHSHTISTGSHSHGVLLANAGATGGVPAGVGNVGNPVTASYGDLGGSTNVVGNLGGNTDAQGSNISINASGTGLSTTNANGGGAALSIIPQFIALNFIIRFQ